MGAVRRRLASRFARGVLLVVLALGVCGMHTLGHLDGGHTASPVSTHGMNPPQQAAVIVGLPAFAPDPGMAGFDPTDVCLAVLTSLMVALVLAAWIRTRRRTGAQGRSPASPRWVARPPPRPTSLRLARLSVLRI
ncbi:DUF6153 family protein [Nonomuraea sp. SYSU D8015]|uniref:DUF6153 family protein n=1 Tax=Nonomuraea sp. SYSU D8015 TaxID=2593644 RepID=UPI0016603C71|nr:DUF6153 family protein [Nonomuraea sp. SYSU D8015]